MKKIRDALVRFDDAIGMEGRALLRPPATNRQIAGASAALGVPLPPPLRELYEWHDGEQATSTLFHDALAAEIGDLWEAFSEEPFVISFMSLDDVVRAGVIGLWLLEDGEASRSPVDDEDAEQVDLVPFAWIRTKGSAESEPGGDDDWLLAVDSSRGAVWLFEVGDQGLEGATEQAASLGHWLDKLASKIRRQSAAKPKPAPVLQSAAVLCLRFLLDRSLIELAEGVTVEDAAKKLAPLLTSKPSKRAVREVLEHLSEDDSIAEVFADDALLARVVSEYVD